LDSRDIADAAVIDTVCQIEKLGEEHYDAYVKERLVSQTKPISDPIKKNNLPLFRRPPVREKTKSQLQVTTLRNGCSLFSQLYIASQVRNGNLDEFFEHENQSYPPVLTQNGKLSGSKSDLGGLGHFPREDQQSWMALLLLICYDRIMQKHSLIMHHKCFCHTLYPKHSMQAE